MADLQNPVPNPAEQIQAPTAQIQTQPVQVEAIKKEWGFSKFMKGLTKMIAKASGQPDPLTWAVAVNPVTNVAQPTIAQSIDQPVQQVQTPATQPSSDLVSKIWNKASEVLKKAWNVSDKILEWAQNVKWQATQFAGEVKIQWTASQQTTVKTDPAKDVTSAAQTQTLDDLGIPKNSQ